MKNPKFVLSVIALAFSFSFSARAIDDARLLRFPDINKDLVVFVYAGDIWSVNSNGGFIPDNISDLLDRKTLSYSYQNGLVPGKSPAIAHDGPKVMLINGFSSSGGDAFPYYFRKLGLGKLIGTRTWGGLVGISGNAGLVDGGYVSVPRFGVFDADEGWIIEGRGVSPDIEVVDRPEQLAVGIDPCIEKAVEVLLQELKDKPVKKVNVPALPDRSKWIEEK